jgi:hypothetical protein
LSNEQVAQEKEINITILSKKIFKILITMDFAVFALGLGIKRAFF